MKKSSISIVLGLFALFFVLVKTKAQTSNFNINEVKAAIAESNIIYFQSFVKGDSSLFIDRYAVDACIMPPNIPAMCGKMAAPDFFKAAYHQMGIRNGKFTTTEIFGNCDYVTEYGKFELRDKKNKIIENGKYLVLWKKTEKGWKMFRDSFSSDNPL